MPEGYLSMSAEERDRSHVIRQIIENRLSQREGGERLDIGIRQVKRLVRVVREKAARLYGDRLPPPCACGVSVLRPIFFPDPEGRAPLPAPRCEATASP